MTKEIRSVEGRSDVRWPDSSFGFRYSFGFRHSSFGFGNGGSFTELHDNPVGLTKRAPFNVRIHKNDVCLAVRLMKSPAVFVTHVRLREINDGRMVQEIREVRDQQCVGRLANGTHPRSGAVGRMARGEAVREIR